MCGISGLLYYSASPEPSEPQQLIGAMNRSIAHRGPDDEGYWRDTSGRVHLGHRRLSILDLSQLGHQPMVSPSGNAIVFNGEIYNFKELRATFKDRAFRSESDTEVLLALYDRDGARCVDRLNGMFAFAVWDEARGKLFLARDQIGIKPLYYTLKNGVFAFSSELRALLTLPWVRAELDEEALYDFLTFNRVSPPRTMFKGIHKFHPGYCMVVGKLGIEQYAPYWEATYGDYAALTEEEIEARVLGELRRSVHAQMISDVPVGAFLSGGVDSSAVVALMSEVTTHPVKTYSVGFEGAPDYDERRFAALISKQFRTDHHERIVTRQDIVEFLPKIVDVYDEPLADATSIPIYFISQAARQNGTIVVLTGDGADELFCGYRGWMRYARLYPFYRLLRNSPAPLRALARIAARRLDESSPAHEMLMRAANQWEFFWGAGGFKESAKRSVLSASFLKRMEHHLSHSHIERFQEMFRRAAPAARGQDYCDWMSFLGLKDIVPNLYLYRADRLGMAHSIELRVPYLDRHLVDLGLSLPGRLKIRNSEPKYILKKSLETLLPKEILYRRKMGFCVPLDEWMKDILVSYVDEGIDQFCYDTGLFDREAIAGMVKRCRQGDPQVVHSLWNIYFLMAWFKRWLP